MAQLTLTIELPSPLLVQTSHPPTRNLGGKTHKVATAVTAWSSSANFIELTGTRTLVAQAKSILRETTRTTASTNDDEDDQDDADDNDDDDGAPHGLFLIRIRHRASGHGVGVSSGPLPHPLSLSPQS